MELLGRTDPAVIGVAAVVLLLVGVLCFVVFVGAAVWLVRRRGVGSPDETVRLPRPVALGTNTEPGVLAVRADDGPDAPPDPPAHLRAVRPLDGRNLPLDERVAGRSLPPGPGLDEP